MPTATGAEGNVHTQMDAQTDNCTFKQVQTEKLTYAGYVGFRAIRTGSCMVATMGTEVQWAITPSPRPMYKAWLDRHTMRPCCNELGVTEKFARAHAHSICTRTRRLSSSHLDSEAKVS